MRMKITAAELDVLHILWASDRPLTTSEMVGMSQFKLFRGAIINSAIDSMVKKKLLVQSGLYQVFSSENELPTYSYTAAISFSDYYMKKFSSISPHNMFRLSEALIRSKKLNPQMLQELSSLLASRIVELSQI